jgi:hypothetical protein
MNYKHCYFTAKEFGNVHDIPSLKQEIINKMQDILTDPLCAYDNQFVVVCKYILKNLSSIVYEKTDVDLIFVHRDRIFASHFVSPPHDGYIYRPSVFDEPKENTLSLNTVLFVDFINFHFAHLIGHTIYGFRTNTADKE